VASVSKVIHTDNQLHPGQFGKAAYTGWILDFDPQRPSFRFAEISPRRIIRKIAHFRHCLACRVSRRESKNKLRKGWSPRSSSRDTSAPPVRSPAAPRQRMPCSARCPLARASRWPRARRPQRAPRTRLGTRRQTRWPTLEGQHLGGTTGQHEPGKHDPSRGLHPATARVTRRLQSIIRGCSPPQPYPSTCNRASR
jgi:hypothetical protein